MVAENAAQYPLGSRQRWIETLFLLGAPFLITYILAWIFFHSSAAAWLFYYLIVMASVFTLGFSVLIAGPSHLPWLNRIMVNLAYGRADESGIHYREWFRWRFVSWKGIARLEYWPESDGRIVLHLYSRQSPVIFVPAESDYHRSSGSPADAPGTVDFIAQKLNDAWPGKSAFLICYESPQPQQGRLAADLLRNLTPRQRAVANAFLLLIFQIGFCLYMLARIGNPRILFIMIVVISGAGIVLGLGARQSRKTRSTEKQALK